jgi:addiction module HigA family antidote
MVGELGIRLKNPPHVGSFIRHEIVEAIPLSVTGAAKALGVTRPALSALLNEHVNLSPEMALRIEKAFGVSMDTLMRMQNSYDIARVRKTEKQIKVKAFVPKAEVD